MRRWCESRIDCIPLIQFFCRKLVCMIEAVSACLVSNLDYQMRHCLAPLASEPYHVKQVIIIDGSIINSKIASDLSFLYDHLPRRSPPQ